MGLMIAIERDPPGHDAGDQHDWESDEEPVSPPPGAHDANRRRRPRLLLGSKAGVVLVDEPLGVEAEVAGVGPEEASHIGRRGQVIESLVLECVEKLRPDPGFTLDLRQLQTLTLTRLTQAAADLEHCGSLWAGATVLRARGGRASALRD
jgi:hypothetical protein